MSGCPVPSAQELMACARLLSGVDRADDDACEPLEQLVASLNGEGRLHAAGAQAMADRLVRILANRLRMQRDYAAHPEIADEVIDRPVFICGMARTGSTKTQKMLAASGDFNWLPYWQVLNPSLWSGERSESTDERIADVDAFVDYFDTASPETRAGHAFATHEPEEESFLLEHSLMTPCFMGWAPLAGYLGWIFTQDMTRQFVMLRDMLRYLQWQGRFLRGKPWVLKSPLYSGLESSLLSVFPDARLVMTHRHPADTMASGLRLLELFYKPFSSAGIDVDFYLAGQAAAIDAHLAGRRALPPGRFFDIDFHQLVRDVRGTAESIYDYVGITPLPDALDRITAWDVANPADKNGRHVYAMADYGLDTEAIDAQFTGYVAFLDDMGIGKKVVEGSGKYR